jgi:hypothetical protein
VKTIRSRSTPALLTRMSSRPYASRAAPGIWEREGTGLGGSGLFRAGQDVLSRFVAALGGTLKLIADFGDEQLKLA